MVEICLIISKEGSFPILKRDLCHIIIAHKGSLVDEKRHTNPNREIFNPAGYK